MKSVTDSKIHMVMQSMQSMQIVFIWLGGLNLFSHSLYG